MEGCAMDEGNIVAAKGRGSRGFAKLDVDSQNVDVATTPRANLDGDRGVSDDDEGLAVPIVTPLGEVLGEKGFV